MGKRGIYRKGSLSRNIFERNTFGVADGYRNADDPNPPDGSAVARDTTGNGGHLEKFRGKYHNAIWIENKLRKENTRRENRKLNRTTKFIDKNFLTTPE